MLTLKPKDINTAQPFMDSAWRANWVEKVARNIVAQQHAANPNEWTAFSADDYARSCRHQVSDLEKSILGLLVDGGEIGETRKVVRPGSLARDATGSFVVTEMFLESLPADVIITVNA